MRVMSGQNGCRDHLVQDVTFLFALKYTTLHCLHKKAFIKFTIRLSNIKSKGGTHRDPLHVVLLLGGEKESMFVFILIFLWRYICFPVGGASCCHMTTLK